MVRWTAGAALDKPGGVTRRVVFVAGITGQLGRERLPRFFGRWPRTELLALAETEIPRAGTARPLRHFGLAVLGFR